MNEKVHTHVQHHFSYEETLIIALHHQSSGSPHNELSQMYGGECTEYAHMMNYFSNLVCHKFYHRLCGRSLEQWVSNVHAYRKAIWKDIFFDGDGNQDVDVPLNQFCPWSWLDCVQHWMFCLGVGPVNEDGDRRENFHQAQQAFCSHYGHAWGMKFQVHGLHNGVRAST